MWTRDLEAEMNSAVICLYRRKFISSGWQCHFNSLFNRRYDLNPGTLRFLCLLVEIILWYSAKAAYSLRTRVIIWKCTWQSGWMCSPRCCTEQGDSGVCNSPVLGKDNCWRQGGWIPLHPSPSMEKIKDCSQWSAKVLQIERGPVPSYIISLSANSSSSVFSFHKNILQILCREVAFFQPGPHPECLNNFCEVMRETGITEAPIPADLTVFVISTKC